MSPIIDARAIPERRLLILADFTMLAAYGPDGLAWRTGQISWDGLRITGVSSDEISGIAWNAPDQRHVSFSVNLKTGAHRGGASPDVGTPLP